MHPSGGLRIEEKKSATESSLLLLLPPQPSSSSSPSLFHPHQHRSPSAGKVAAPPPHDRMAIPPDLRSSAASSSYQSTPSTRSSVLERAREYNRRIQDEQNRRQQRTAGDAAAAGRRAKSLERGGGFGGYDVDDDATERSGSAAASQASRPSHHGAAQHLQRRRSRSAGAASASSATGGNRMSTRERALASVRKDMQSHQKQPPADLQHDPFAAPALSPTTSAYTASTSSRSSQQPAPSKQRQQQQPQQQPQQQQPSPYGTRSPAPNHQQQQHHHHHPHHHSPAPASRGRAPGAAAPHTHSAAPATSHPRPLPHSQPPAPSQPHPSQPHPSRSPQPGTPATGRAQQPAPQPRAAAPSSPPLNDGADPPQPDAAVVTPELLVDALSGHEDGLLAIAERLMEHYDRGYDVMGEAIIDAFADVQKLFQHVVEAAHMEGAAFEASRRDEEEQNHQRHRSTLGMGGSTDHDLLLDLPQEPAAASPANGNGSPAGPARHDEFIDQDVQDVLTEAIRRGSLLRDANKHTECYELYDRACQAASSLLPVDSDHRGRLQLSLARADSMAADRACAILRYAMDDVLRSGLRAARTPLPDPSRRADVVLTRPGSHPSTSGPAAVVQSPDEALQSLVDELQELLAAPLYADQPSAAPLQTAAKRFWAALADARKAQKKNAERLEQQLGKLKGDYLLAKAEWEERLNQANARAESYKNKYERLKESMREQHQLPNAASSSSASFWDQPLHSRHSDDPDASAMHSIKSTPSKTGSVASFGSGLAQQAKTLVHTMNAFNCTALNERTGFTPTPTGEASSGLQQAFGDDDLPYEARRTTPVRGRTPVPRGRSANPSSAAANRPASRSFREYSKSPQRVDV